MSQETVQDNVQEPAQDKVQEVATDSQSNTETSSDSGLLQEVMSKKGQIKDLQNELASMKAKEEGRRKELLIAEGKKDEVIAELELKVKEGTTAIERLNTLEANQREYWLGKLPEDKQDKFSNHPIEVIQDLAEEYGQPTTVKVDNQSPGTFNGYSSMAEWATSDPVSYRKQTADTRNIKIGYK